MQQIGFPIQIPFIPKEDDPVRLLFEVTEGLDYTNLYKTPSAPSIYSFTVLFGGPECTAK